MSPKNEAIVLESTDVNNPESPAKQAPTQTPSPKAESPETNGSKRAKPRRSTWSAVDPAVIWFAACARCSIFLAGYQVENGNLEPQTSNSSDSDGWLKLNWNQALCKLVRKSYGSRVEIDCYHYDGSCPECHRQFVYRASDNGDSPGYFYIELKPHTKR